jgi:hypothetical protein
MGEFHPRDWVKFTHTIPQEVISMAQKIEGLDDKGQVILPKSLDEICFYPVFLLRTKDCYVCRDCGYDECLFVVIANSELEAVKEFISDEPLCLLCFFKDMAEGDIGSSRWTAFRVIDWENDDYRCEIESIWQAIQESEEEDGEDDDYE